MIAEMATEPTPLRPSPHHDYESWTTTWYDEQGHRRTKRFGKVKEVARRIAHARYNNWLQGEWQAKAHVRNPDDPNQYTVGMLCDEYLEHAKTIYRKNGRETSHMDQVRLAIKALKTAHEHLPVEAIEAPHIAKLVLKMVDSTGRHGKGRTLTCSTVNGRLRIIRQTFAWGRLYAHVPREVAYDVSLVKPLKPGRSKAAESREVLPVPLDVLNATLAESPKTVADMAWLQYWTGMRSGEVCQLRPSDIQVDDKGRWTYRPRTHKTEHHKRTRVVPIGPEGRKILQPYIDKRKLTEFVFLPEDAHRERLEQIGHPAVMAYQMSRSVFKPGRAFRGDTYYNKIAYACDRAFDPKGEKRAKGDYSHRWHPHRLRHNAATRMRAAGGIEATSDVLGHASVTTTAIYAERSLERMQELAEKAG